MKLIGNGAEAKIYLDVDSDKVVKRRIEKGYRIKEIDEPLRKQRTRREARILEKLKGLVPEFIAVDEEKMEMSMQYIEGQLVKEAIDILNDKKRDKIMQKIGENVGRMHLLNVAHGDLTTSNMILSGNDVKLIDFGLSFVSDKIEDKAVDIHLLKHALESKHYQHFEKLFASFLEGYKRINPEFNQVIERFKLVEKRGRYKRRMGS
jgi:TP53 regulating kinase-like protein